MAKPTPRQLALIAAEICDDKKAKDIIILDVRKVTTISDYFIICSTSNERQARAIAEELRLKMRELGKVQMGVEGMQDGRWVLQDFADIVLHVFHESQREFYDIEGLWADAKQVRWKKPGRKS
ncbi:MAG TPA: ribosome silencing factor [Planctomycetota bacterium]|nr:ribosome silencing factor [Planctomycetota bacterium]